MQIHSLGHAVLKVRDIERSVRFYTGVLGLREVGRTPSGSMVFFAIAGNHHDFGIQRVAVDEAASDTLPGLAHLAFKLGTDPALLPQARDWLVAHGVSITAVMDHVVTQSIYFRDPDNNGLEVFVEAGPEVWVGNPSVVASGKPLQL